MKNCVEENGNILLVKGLMATNGILHVTTVLFNDRNVRLASPSVHVTCLIGPHPLLPVIKTLKFQNSKLPSKSHVAPRVIRDQSGPSVPDVAVSTTDGEGTNTDRLIRARNCIDGFQAARNLPGQISSPLRGDVFISHYSLNPFQS